MNVQPQVALVALGITALALSMILVAIPFSQPEKWKRARKPADAVVERFTIVARDSRGRFARRMQ